MSLVTKIWGNKASPNLFTTVPARVRDQLGVSPDCKLEWRLEGSFAEVRCIEPPIRKGMPCHSVFKQSRSNSVYATVPTAVIEQLRLSDRSRAEWELHGDKAHVRRA